VAALVATVSLVPWAWQWSLIALAFFALIYMAQALRIAFSLSSKGMRFPDNLKAAWLIIVSKTPQVIGQLLFLISSRRSLERSAIEYK
jgi:hypothetical protein